MQDRLARPLILGLLVSLVLCSSSFGEVIIGDVFVLGRSSGLQRHIWRFDVDGTYRSDIAPENAYGGIVLPGDGYLYGVSSYGDLTRMAFDGSGKTPVDISPIPISVMGEAFSRHFPFAASEAALLPESWQSRN